MRKQNEIIINTPTEFSFKECLTFLSREPNEILHKIEGETFYKLLQIDKENILIKVTSPKNNKLHIEALNTGLEKKHIPIIENYIVKLFDLDNDISEFYKLCKKDKIMNSVADKYYGLRIIGIPNLFEALCWAIIGQHINLKFAYTIKKNFTEQYGESIEYNGVKHWLFPNPEVVADLSVNELNKLQFTKKKAEYIIGIAEEIKSGSLKFGLNENANLIECKLLALKGIGKWTAHYVMMKYFQIPLAFPIADVGLHNALKEQMGLAEKPSIEEIEKYFEQFRNWEAYTTFYLWRSLI
ncbi:MAG: DNA-3-methyladenine glycosylase 2 family protein [Tenericutes bacterium]|nr:DNA-3-methyladenine glycosylase 2 family protein [Mycoplasmatota bacterium]MBI9009667.1 DNA-3-methyladenine glycosylase 2 family protein [Mycoplasmatota bacterium]